MLIVDDDEEDFEHLRGLLTPEGGNDLEVHWAATARQALERVERERFDCVIVDYRLTDGDGIYLIQAFHDLLGDDAPPSILVTGYPDTRVSKAAFRGGAIDFFDKGGITESTIRRAVARATERPPGSRPVG